MQLIAYEIKRSCASSNPPFVLSGIPLSSQPEQVQDIMLCLALLHSGRPFHSSTRELRLLTIIARNVVLAGYLFCSVASCLHLIIANSSACNEGGVSSRLSSPHASS